MKKAVQAVLAIALLAPLAGCYSPQDRALGGAAIGGAGGAIIGAAASGGRAGGTLVGAAVGAASGAMIGAATSPPQGPRCAQWGYDYYGNPVCLQVY